MLDKIKERAVSIYEDFGRINLLVRIFTHSIYLLYLAYAISNDIGVTWINITLLVATLIFLCTYIYLHSKGRSAKKQIKLTRRFYRRFKLVARFFSLVAVSYGFYSVFDASSLLARIAASFAALIWLLQVIFEIIFSAIGYGARKFAKAVREVMPKRESDPIIIDYEDKTHEKASHSDK